LHTIDVILIFDRSRNTSRPLPSAIKGVTAMARQSAARRALYSVILAVTFLLTGCGSQSSQPQNGSTSPQSEAVNIVPAALLTSITADLQRNASRALAGWEWTGFITSFSSLLTSLKYNLSIQKVIYQSTGADGKLHMMSGLLILPKSFGSGKPSVPILMFQHGTEPYRPYSPSQFLAHLDRPTDYPEVMVAAAIASTGYAVAMADYEGMGDNSDIQPYLHGASLAQQVIDMLKTSRDIIGGTSGNNASPCSWNGQLFLMGYSEGGYVTMATTRELQLNHAGEFTVTASAPLSGPHDLSGVMRGIMLSGTSSKAPYYLPFILNGYNYAYAGKTNLFSADFALKPAYTSIPQLFDGTQASDKISEAMGMSFSPVQLIVPESILAQQFIDQLSIVTSPLVAYLSENDSYRGWVPTIPIRMYHHKSDELVPYGNSQVAFNAFSTAGAKKWVSLVEETAAISISSDPVKTVHLSAAFPELSDGWRWLDSFRK
jgi:Secretory lipase